MTPLAGTNALVTGATSGIGRVVPERLAGERAESILRSSMVVQRQKEQTCP
jgi:NAD(P)-dependent dehydrogenase (short-subunit alcohol dehydrogenase family)